MATTGTSHTTASPLERHASPVQKTGKGAGTAALILGIIGVVASLIPIIGVILGVLAVVRGGTARKACRKRGGDIPWQATAGYVLGIVAIVASIAVFVVNVALMA